MPLILNVGLSKKLGQPRYGSLGASCQVAVELDQALLFTDLEGFHDQVRLVFSACAQAVQDELDRQQPPCGESGATGEARPSGNGQAATYPPDRRPPPRDPLRPATASQVRTLESLARQHQVRLEDILRIDFGYTQPGELSVREASRLIDELKALAQRPPPDQASGGDQ